MVRSLVAAAALAAGVAAQAKGLYGLGMSAPGQFWVLQSIAKDGTTTNIGQQITGELVAQQLSDIDQAKAVYYYVGFNMAKNQSELVGLSLADGSETARVKLPFYEPGFVGVGQQVAAGMADGSVIVGGQMAPNTPHVIGTLDVTSGAFKQVASFPVSLLPVLGGVSAYNPATGLFVTELGTSTSIGWYWVNMGNGQTGSWQDCDTLETLSYNPATKGFIGVGLYPNRTRLIATMDGTTGSCNVLGQVPGYFIIEAGMGALDAASGQVWTIMQPSTGGQNAPFDLLQISTAGGVSVLSNNTLEACPNPSDCPWQVEFYYGA